MAVLDRYVRLEALGIWRESRDAPPREVVVRFGRSTLLLTDLAETPLGHWALAGVTVLGRERGATVYAMCPDGETLAIRDPEMIAAIAAVARPRPEPRRRRRIPLAGMAAVALLAASAAFAPGWIRAQAVRMVPPEGRAELGDRMLIALIEARGPPCADPAGDRALARLGQRLDPRLRLRVLDLGAPVAALPGGTVLLDRAAVAAAAAPEELAGWAALALGRDPLDQLLRSAGAARDLRYVLTGELGEAALARAAAAAPAPPSPAEAGPALARLADAGLDPRPFAAALARAGVAVPLPAVPAAPAPALADQDWVALQGICG
jgi:hypothetical protein